MANRQVKFVGYTNNSCNIVFTFNSIEVFNGQVSAGGTESSPVELFGFEIDQTIDGNINGTTVVSGGDITFITLSTSHNSLEDTSSTMWIGNGENGSKTDITIDDVVYDKGDTSGLSGSWHISIADGQSMTCTFPIVATPTSTPTS